jgi:hypothetical protein
MSIRIPFESFRVLATGEPYAFFQVSVQPAYWSRQGFGEDSEIQKQRKFIQDAIREKIERERKLDEAAI